MQIVNEKIIRHLKDLSYLSAITKLISMLNDIEYGWLSKNGAKYFEVNDFFIKDYVLQSPEEIILNKIGICWDQVELERYYFQLKKLKFNTYFLVYYGNDKCPSHTFLVYKKSNKFYWFEHSWNKYKGIYEYNSLKELLTDVRNKFICYNKFLNEFNSNDLCLYEYTQPKFGMTVKEFYNHCESGRNIDIDGL